MKFSQLITKLKESQVGLISQGIQNDIEIVSGASIELAKELEITFLERGNILASQIETTNASAILLPDDKELIQVAKNRNINWASLTDPRLAFAVTLELINPPPKPNELIHKTSVIGDNVTIGKRVSIGAKVCIGNNCSIADDVVIHPGVVIYENVEIDLAVEIHANAVIHSGTKIGKRCVIHSNSVLGSEGFGFVPTKNGWRKMPQTGYVVLEEEVEIGCGSCVDRPSVGKTYIGAGTKIDNLVQIGHGVSTGKACAMASQVGIAGGAKIGDGVILAGQVGVGNRAVVGDRVIASSKSGITGKVNSGEIVSGFPAIPNRIWLRCAATFNKLPEMLKILKTLQKKGSG